MGQPAAKQGDQVVGRGHAHRDGADAVGPVPTPLPHPFAGMLNGGLSANVNIMGKPAATVGSTADNTPPHVADAARHGLPEAAGEPRARSRRAARPS